MYDVFGSITFSRRSSAAKVWQQMVDGHPALEIIETCQIINPMTGDTLNIVSPPNLLAEIISDGRRVGVVRLPKLGTEFEVHFHEADRAIVQPLLAEIASSVGGTLHV